MNLSEAEIRDRLDKWFGLRYASYPPEMIGGMKAILSLPADQRERTMNAFQAFICLHCGGDDPHCQCWNDE